MKRILFLLAFAIGFVSADAQTWQKVAGRWQYQFFRSDSTFTPPQDTLAIAPVGSYAQVNGNLFYKNPTWRKYSRQISDSSFIVGRDTITIKGTGGGATNYYSITDFGAVGDGVTDNTNAINNTINAAAATKGIVFIPPGVWAVRASYRDTAVVYKPQGIKLRSNVTIKGAGIGRSVIKLADVQPDITMSTPSLGVFVTNGLFFDVIKGDTVSNVVLNDFSVDCNYDHQVNYNINPYGNPELHEIPFIQSDGIRFRGGTNNRISNVRVDSCAGFGINIDSCTNSLVEKCILTTCINGGVLGYKADGSVIQNNLVTNTHCDNIRILVSKNISILNNECSWSKFNPAPGLNNFAGIYVQSFLGYQITGINISGNNCHDNSSFGIDIWNGFDTSTITQAGVSALINNNTVMYNANGGMEIAMRNVSITGNAIYNNGANSSNTQDPQFYRPYGINLNKAFTPESDNILISNNTFIDTRGYQAYAVGNGGSGLSTSLTFSNNTCVGGTGMLQPGVIASVPPFSTVIGNTYKANSELETISYLNGILKVNSTTGAEGITISGVNPALRLGDVGGSEKHAIANVTIAGSYFTGTTDNDLVVYGTPASKIVMGFGNTSNSTMSIRDGMVGIGTINPFNLSGAFGGSNQRTKLWLKSDDNNTYSSLVISGGSGGGAATIYTNQAGASLAALGVTDGSELILANWQTGQNTTFYTRPGSDLAKAFGYYANGNISTPLVTRGASITDSSVYINPATGDWEYRRVGNIATASQSATGSYTHDWNQQPLKIDSISFLNLNGTDVVSGRRQNVNISQQANTFTLPYQTQVSVRTSDNLTDSIVNRFRIFSQITEMSTKYSDNNGSSAISTYKNATSLLPEAAIGASDGTFPSNRNSYINANPTRISIVAQDSITIKGIESAASADTVVGLIRTTNNEFKAQRVPMIKVLKGTTNWTPGTVAAGSSASTNITVTGAALGDPVSISKASGAYSNGEIYDAWVSAANTVTIRVHNVSTGSASYGTAADYNVIVHKY